MLHPSYNELVDAAGMNADDENQPASASRYSIVIATAKRARELIAGEEAAVPSYGKKPLSVAIEELHRGKISIQNPEDPEDDVVNGENPEEIEEAAAGLTESEETAEKAEAAEIAADAAKAAEEKAEAEQNKKE